MSFSLVNKDEPFMTGLLWAVGLNGIVGLVAVIIEGTALLLSSSPTQELFGHFGRNIFKYALPGYEMAVGSTQPHLISMGVAWLALSLLFYVAIGKRAGSTKAQRISTTTFFLTFPFVNYGAGVCAGTMVAIIGITQHGI